MHEYVMDHNSVYKQAEWVNIAHETFCVHDPVRIVVTEHVNIMSRHQFRFSWKVT